VSHAGEGAVNVFDYCAGVRSVFHPTQYSFLLRIASCTKQAVNLAKNAHFQSVLDENPTDLPL
jgi:hypothetical protein